MRKNVVFFIVLFLLVVSLTGCSTGTTFEEDMEKKLDEADEMIDGLSTGIFSSYVVSVESAVLIYKDNNGKLPTSYCDIEQYIDFYDVLDKDYIICNVMINDDSSINLEHCKVGDYGNSSYSYDKYNGIRNETKTVFAKPIDCN